MKFVLSREKLSLLFIITKYITHLQEKSKRTEKGPLKMTTTLNTQTFHSNQAKHQIEYYWPNFRIIILGGQKL